MGPPPEVFQHTDEGELYCTEGADPPQFSASDIPQLQRQRALEFTRSLGDVGAGHRAQTCGIRLKYDGGASAEIRLALND